MSRDVGPPPGDSTARLGDGSGARGSEAAAVSPGEVIAGRYLVEAFLASGGMGEVFRAHDLILDERVALKTIRPEIASQPRAMERFRREIQLARKVTHPNVCRIFDVLHHPTARGDVPVLTMELLEGETLSARLRREGPLPQARALPIAQQIVAALTAAHAAGVIHRDLKASNIVIAPAREGERVVVVDFGLARPDAESHPGHARATTENDVLVGTPAYVAPEQISGGEITPATDIYALGIVLYELVTGRVPFIADTPMATATKRLIEDPAPPRRFAPDLDRAWQAAILRCLARRPRDRFRSAAEVARALVRPEPRGRRLLALVIGAGVVAAAVGGSIRSARRPPPPSPIRGIAVLPFRDPAPDPAHVEIADGVSDELITRLSQIGGLKVISRTSAERYRGHEQPISQVARELAVEAVVEGSVRHSGDRVHVTVKLVSGADDRVLWAQSYDREIRDTLTLQAEVARDVAGQVRSELTPEERRSLQGSGGRVAFEAWEELVRGRIDLAKGPRDELQRAIEHFRNAIARQPDYAEGYASLSVAYVRAAHTGLIPRASAFTMSRFAAERASSLDPTLGAPYMALAFIARDEWDWPRADGLFRRARALAPGDNRVVGGLSHYLTETGRFEEGFAEARRALAIDPLSPLDHLVAATAAYYAGHYAEARAISAAILTIAPSHPSPPLLLVVSDLIEGRRTAALRTCDEGLQRTPDNRKLRLVCGGLAGAVGRVKESERVFSWLEERHRAGDVSAYDLGDFFLIRGDIERAADWFELAYQEHSPDMPSLWVESTRIAGAGDHPRIRAILEKMRFPLR